MGLEDIVTARGRHLNMFELKRRQSKPMESKGGVKVDAKDKVERQQRPPKQANVRGFMPSMKGVSNKSSKPVPAAVVYAEEKEDVKPSIAQLTGVVIDNSDSHVDKSVRPHEALDNIIGDLEQMRKHDSKGDSKGRHIK